MNDNLLNIRNLPKHILAQLQQLIVNRVGSSPDAVMLTRDIVGVVSPSQSYQLVNQSTTRGNSIALKPVPSSARDFPMSKGGSPINKPKHAALKGSWVSDESVFNPDANILGGMGALVLSHNEVVNIPVIEATAESLAYYNAYLLPIGSTVKFETRVDLPVTEVVVGTHYVNHYLSQDCYGGGEYIEYHDQPHLWAPQNQKCSGHILLGHHHNDTFYLTAFKIPFGHAVYLSPYTLHSDAYLVGDYLVVYTVTDKYSTVLFKDKHMLPKRLSFV